MSSKGTKPLILDCGSCAFGSLVKFARETPEAFDISRLWHMLPQLTRDDREWTNNCLTVAQPCTKLPSLPGAAILLIVFMLVLLDASDNNTNRNIVIVTVLA